MATMLPSMTGGEGNILGLDLSPVAPRRRESFAQDTPEKLPPPAAPQTLSLLAALGSMKLPAELHRPEGLGIERFGGLGWLSFRPKKSFDAKLSYGEFCGKVLKSAVLEDPADLRPLVETDLGHSPGAGTDLPVTPPKNSKEVQKASAGKPSVKSSKKGARATADGKRRYQKTRQAPRSRRTPKAREADEESLPLSSLATGRPRTQRRGRCGHTAPQGEDEMVSLTDLVLGKLRCQRGAALAKGGSKRPFGRRTKAPEAEEELTLAQLVAKKRHRGQRAPCPSGSACSRVDWTKEIDEVIFLQDLLPEGPWDSSPPPLPDDSLRHEAQKAEDSEEDPISLLVKPAKKR